MCGSGRICVAILRAGIDLCCVDYSAGLLARLRARLGAERGPGWGEAELVEADLRTLELPRRFGFAFVGFHAIAELAEPEDLRAGLTAIRRLLRDDPERPGVAMISMHDPAVRGPECDGEWVELGTHPLPGCEAGRSVEVRGRWQLGEAGLVEGTQVYVERDASGAELDRVELPVRFRLYAPAQVEAVAAELGLRLRERLGGYPVPGRPPPGPDARYRVLAFEPVHSRQ
jgi:hypothetical protein